jgi:hypothetical protein
MDPERAKGAADAPARHGSCVDRARLCAPGLSSPVADERSHDEPELAICLSDRPRGFRPHSLVSRQVEASRELNSRLTPALPRVKNPVLQFRLRCDLRAAISAPALPPHARASGCRPGGVPRRDVPGRFTVRIGHRMLGRIVEATQVVVPTSAGTRSTPAGARAS